MVAVSKSVEESVEESLEDVRVVQGITEALQCPQTTLRNQVKVRMLLVKYIALYGIGEGVRPGW